MEEKLSVPEDLILKNLFTEEGTTLRFMCQESVSTQIITHHENEPKFIAKRGKNCRS